jgi:hypothetical protein
MAEPRSAIRDILASCLDDMERDGLTAEACLERYPAYAAELRPLLMAAGMLSEAPVVKPPAAFRRQARSRLMVRIQPPGEEKVTFLEMARQKLRPSSAGSPGRRLGLAWVLLLVLLATVLLTAGTAYASDAAVPGQPLYTLDRSLERIRAGITRDPAALVTVQLAFADERLSEARVLAGDAQSGNFKEALAGYGESIGTVVQTIGAAGEVAGKGLDRILDEALSGHEGQLVRLASPPEDEMLDGSESEKRYCGGDVPHPVAQSLAEQYGANAEQIMGWFCGSGDGTGFGFGQIMLALRKGGQLGSDAPSTAEILERRASGEGWGQIWKDLGVKGKPAEVGPPEHAGPKDKARGPEQGGPPDHAGPKDKN